MAKEQDNKNEEAFFSSKLRRIIAGLLFLLMAVIGILSGFNKAGRIGDFLKEVSVYLFGGMSALLPVLIFMAGWVFLRTKYKKFIIPLILGEVLVLFGTTSFFTTLASGFNLTKNPNRIGGEVGLGMSKFLIELLGPIASSLIYLIVTVIGLVFFWHLLYKDASFVEAVENFFERRQKKRKQTPSVIKKIFSTKFETKSLETSNKEKKQSKKEKDQTQDEATQKRAKQTNTEVSTPPLDLLEKGEGSADPGDTKSNSKAIEETLSNFDIPVEMSEINVGPTVTQYTLKPAEGIKLSKITSLSDDLALALAKHPVRTEAPIPGKSLVGIEVPNEEREMIRLRDVLSDQFDEHPSSLTMALGKDVSGAPVYTDLGQMPHILVAGATGSGKTIFLNSLILSLIYKNSPEELRLILVDPKRVEFSLYKRLPHLLTSVIYNAEKTHNALEWLVGELERRFDVLSEVKKRNIDSYNEWARDQEDEEVMPYIVLVVDELADLMAQKQNEIEDGIVRIAQMARAVGIHLILATQRPSVEVITGLIKANITARVSFQVASQVDSRTILDMGGAEKLLGAGDMLFISSDSSEPQRVQAPYVSEEEVKSVVNWLVDRKEEVESQDDDLSEELEDELEKDRAQKVEENMEEDELYEDAKDLVIRADKASASMLQRKLRIGYVRAARILDMLEARGIVGPSRGSKARVVYGEDGKDEKKEQDQELDMDQNNNKNSENQKDK